MIWWEESHFNETCQYILLHFSWQIAALLYWPSFGRQQPNVPLYINNFPWRILNTGSPIMGFLEFKQNNHLKIWRYTSSLCCTFSTCHLWELEAVQMEKPAGGREIPALLNEKRLGSQLSHSTKSVHSAVILACSMVQSWCVPPSCLPDNILVWLWGCFTRVTSLKANSDCIASDFVPVLQCSQILHSETSHRIPSSPSAEPSTHNLIFRL